MVVENRHLHKNLCSSKYESEFKNLLSFIRIIHFCIWAIMRAMWFCGGFHWIKVKGDRAPPSEVPIVAAAPHSSYFDAIPVTMMMCSIVGKHESRSVPVWGSKSYIFTLTTGEHNEKQKIGICNQAEHICKTNILM